MYYIPQTVPNRIKTDWHRYNWDPPYADATGDLSLTDYANTYSATNLSGLFIETTITALPKLNMSNVTDMSRICESNRYNDGKKLKITIVDARGWDTANVTNMAGLFYDCDALTALDVSNFSTANVTNMSSMFNGCSGLTALDVSNFSTANVTNMSFVFGDCSGLTTLDVSNWDTANVTNMSSMFNGCSGLTALDVSNFSTANVTNMSFVFGDCSGLTTLDVSNWDTANVINMSYMFYSCSGLTTLDASNWDTANVTDMSSMFSGCSRLTKIIGIIDMNSCTNCKNMLEACYNLTDVHLRNVPRSLDMSSIGGKEGKTYIIDNYLD